MNDRLYFLIGIVCLVLLAGVAAGGRIEAAESLPAQCDPAARQKSLGQKFTSRRVRTRDVQEVDKICPPLPAAPPAVVPPEQGMATSAFIRADDARFAGKADQVIARYTRTLQCDPEKQKPFDKQKFYKNSVYRRQLQVDVPEARRDCVKTQTVAYADLAQARLLQADYEGALKDSNEALKLDPLDPRAYYVRGRARAAMKDKLGAQLDLQLAANLFLNQRNVDAYDAIVDLRYQLAVPGTER